MQKVCHLLNRGLWISVSPRETLLSFMDQLPPTPHPPPPSCLISQKVTNSDETQMECEKQKFVGELVVQ